MDQLKARVFIAIFLSTDRPCLSIIRFQILYKCFFNMVENSQVQLRQLRWPSDISNHRPQRFSFKPEGPDVLWSHLEGEKREREIGLIWFPLSISPILELPLLDIVIAIRENEGRKKWEPIWKPQNECFLQERHLKTGLCFTPFIAVDIPLQVFSH